MAAGGTRTQSKGFWRPTRCGNINRGEVGARYIAQTPPTPRPTDITRRTRANRVPQDNRVAQDPSRWHTGRKRDVTISGPDICVHNADLHLRLKGDHYRMSSAAAPASSKGPGRTNLCLQGRARRMANGTDVLPHVGDMFGDQLRCGDMRAGNSST